MNQNHARTHTRVRAHTHTHTHSHWRWILIVSNYVHAFIWPQGCLGLQWILTVLTALCISTFQVFLHTVCAVCIHIYIGAWQVYRTSVYKHSPIFRLRAKRQRDVEKKKSLEAKTDPVTEPLKVYRELTCFCEHFWKLYRVLNACFIRKAAVFVFHAILKIFSGVKHKIWTVQGWDKDKDKDCKQFNAICYDNTLAYISQMGSIHN